MYPSLVIFHTAKFARYPYTQDWCAVTMWGKQGVLRRARLPRTARLWFCATFPEHSHWLSSWIGNVLFMTLIMESLGKTGFPIPRSEKIFYRMFLKFFCYLHFFSYHSLWATLIEFQTSLHKRRIIWADVHLAGMFCTKPAHVAADTILNMVFITKTATRLTGACFNFVWFPEPYFHTHWMNSTHISWRHSGLKLFPWWWDMPRAQASFCSYFSMIL